MPYTPITELSPIDLTAEELAAGDLGEHSSKITSAETKIQTQLNDIAAALPSINTMGTELETTQLTEITAINAERQNRIDAVGDLQTDIDGLEDQVDNLNAGDIGTLSADLTALEEAQARESTNRAAEDAKINASIATLQANLDTIKARTGVELDAAASTKTAIDQLLASVSGLTIASIADLQSTLTDKETRIMETTPNHFSDHGRFLAPGADFTYDLNASAFDDTVFKRVIAEVNGADFANMSEAGRFYYNNNNNGGTGGTNNTVATDFAEAMGLGESRYSPTWAVMQVQTGTGTTGVTHAGHYRFMITNPLTQELIGEDVACSMWIESDDTLAMPASSSTRQLWIDGVYQDTNSQYYDGSFIVLPANTVYHIAQTLQLNADYPYNGYFPYVLAKLSTNVRFALISAKPVFGQMPIHNGVNY